MTGAGEYGAFDAPVIRATPKEGYRLAYFYDTKGQKQSRMTGMYAAYGEPDESGAVDATFIPTKDDTITAVFEPTGGKVRVRAGMYADNDPDMREYGVIAVNGVPLETDTAYVDPSAEVTLSVIPTPGLAFMCWSEGRVSGRDTPMFGDIYYGQIDTGISEDRLSYTFTAQQDRVICAVFRAVPTYTVTFNANGSLGLMEAQTVSNGFPLPPCAFFSPEHAFIGWNTAPDGSGTAVADGEAASFGKDTTLYAQWAPFTVKGFSLDTYDWTAGKASAGGGIAYEFVPGFDRQEDVYGFNGNIEYPCTVKLTAEAREGYAFIGWYDAVREDVYQQTLTPVMKTLLSNQPEFSLVVPPDFSGEWLPVSAVFVRTGSEGVTRLDLPSDLTAIEDGAFMGTNAVAVVVPEGCNSIGQSAFEGAESLRQIAIPAGCEVGEDALKDCGPVLILGDPGTEDNPSSAKHYADTHGNCYFAPLPAQ